MSPWKRAGLGGILGALFVLILHPDTRPYYANSLWRLGDSPYLESSGYLVENVARIKQPGNISEGAYWLLVGGEVDRKWPGLRKKDVEKLIFLASRCAAMQPDNAFWPQVLSILYESLGNKEESLRHWSLASTKLRWDDLQNVRLQSLVSGLQADEGANLGWHNAYAYGVRSHTLAQRVLSHGRTLLHGVPLDSEEGLKIRFETLANGRLLRDGARSIETGERGFSLIEMATYPPSLERTPSQKKLLLARGMLVNRLRDRGLISESTAAQAAFDSNDAWLALVSSQSAQEKARDLSIVAVIAAALPGGFVVVALVGALLGLFGKLVEMGPFLQHLFRTPIAPVMGVVLAIFVYAGTQLPLPSLWVVLCLSFFAFEPTHQRKSVPENLGPLFRFTLMVLGTALIVVTCLIVAGWTAPGLRLFPTIGIPREYGAGSTVLLGLAGIVLGMLLVTAPAWGMVKRYSPQKLAGFAMRECGVGICVAGIVLAVISGPLALFVDRRVGHTLEKLLVNEPTFYLIQ